MKIEIEGVPNKPQAIVLSIMAIYVVGLCIFLVVGVERFSQSAIRLYAFLSLIPFAILLCIFFFVYYYFPNMKEVALKFIKNYSFMEEFGYTCETYFIYKNYKELIFQFDHDKFFPIVFYSFLRYGTIPYFLIDNDEIVNIWLLLEYMDEDLFDKISKDEDSNNPFQECLKILVDLMESNFEFFAKELYDCYNLTFNKYEMPDSRSADYCLSCYGGSCFIDFNKKDDLIYLERISFDGFGCFNVANDKATLTQEESQRFEEEMKTNQPKQRYIRPLVLHLIDLNKASIDESVFEQYPLLRLEIQS